MRKDEKYEGSSKPGFEQRLREMNAELLISSVRQHELIDKAGKAETALLLSEERFRGLMEQAPLSIQLFDPEGRTTRVNHAWEALWGTTLEQLGEYNILDDPQLKTNGIAPDMRRAFEGEAVDLPPIRYDPNETLRGISTNQDPVRWVSAVAYPLKGADGEVREVALVHQDITERKRAEDKLAEQKTLLEALAESVLDGILIVSPDGRMLHYNQQFLDIWNFPPEIVESKSDEAALAWAAEQTTDPAAFLGRVDHIYSQPDIQFREEMWMKDGRVYERFGAPVHHGESRLGWVWTFRDITERKRSEEALRDSETRLRTMADSIPQLAWMAEPDGFIFWYNVKWYDYTGTTPEQMEGWGWQSVHDQNRLPDVLKKWTGCIITGEPFEMEFPLQGADGKFRWFLTRVNPLRDAEGNIIRWFGTNTDIDDSRRIQEALRESEKRFAKAFNSSPLSITITSLKTGRLVEVNDTFVGITGYSREEAVGKTTTELGLWEQTEDRETELQKVASDGHIRDREYRFRMKDGSELIGLLSAELIDIGGERCALTVIQDITERNRAEAALRQSEERFSRFMQYLPGLAWIKDTDGRYVYANNAAVQAFRTPREQLYGKTDAEIFSPEIASRFRENDELALTRRTGVQTVEKLEREDGQLHHSIVNKFPILDPDGRTGLVGGMAIDITDRMRAEKALLESEERYRSLFDNAPMAIFVCDRDAVIQNYNHIAAEFWGREPACGVEQHCGSVKLWLPDGHHLPHGQSPMVEVLRTGIPAHNVEVFIERPDGSRLPVLVNFSALKSENGEITGAITSFVDITDRKTIEEALRESERRFRLLADNISQLAWMTNPDGHIFWYNERWFEFTGTTLEEMQGWGWQKVHHPDEVERVVEKFKRHIASGETWEDTFQLRSKDGEYRWFLSRALPIRDGEGNVVRWFGTNTDITNLRDAEKALRESEDRRQLAENAGNVGIFDTDILAHQTYWSETMWTIYGESGRDVNPDEKFWSDHIHGTDRDRVKANIRQTMDADTSKFADEYRIVRSDGTIRWIEVMARVSRDADGVATRMYGVNLDITHRKEAEEKIKRSEYQLRMVTDTVPALISYVDSSERYRFVNQKYIDWFGKPRESIIGKTIADIAGAQAYSTVKPWIDKALAGEECTFEAELPLKGAGARFVRVSYSPDLAVEGAINGFYALISDQTELKRSQDLLRSTEERIGLIMEHLTDYAIFSMDSEGRIETWNDGAESIFGYTDKEILGLSFELLFVPDDVARGAPIREMRAARQKGRVSDERWHVRKDGSRFFASGVTMPLYVGGTLAGYAKIASDLTEKQRHAEELQRAHDELEVRVVDRTKELGETNLALLEEMEEREIAEKQRIDLLRRLVSSQESERRRIARDIHDTLGQRLTALRLKIASLRQAASADEDFASRVEHLQEISERLDSEVSFTAWELRPSALDDLGLAEAVGTFVSEWSRHYEIPADFHSGRLPKKSSNHETETHLYRITQEALNNIAKHSGAKNVSVLIERRDEILILIIEDDGKGFDQSKLPPPVESGKGLGLLGMAERATLVGGNVEIESAPGKGTTIYARVPFFAK